MHNGILRQEIGDETTTTWLAQMRVKVRPLAKRTFDLWATLILIITVLPVFSLIMLAILLNGQTPFYSHVRIGKGGREFGCLKFRTMRRDADLALAQLLQRDPAAKTEWEKNRKLRHDPRVTCMGKFLRATSLDELPQFFNILLGQMSLVGPRPVTRDEFIKFYGPCEAAAYRSIRPGLTGLWQVSGRSQTSYHTRVALDTRYAQSLSLRGDLVILLQTVNTVVRQRGAW